MKSKFGFSNLYMEHCKNFKYLTEQDITVEQFLGLKLISRNLLTNTPGAKRGLDSFEKFIVVELSKEDAGDDMRIVKLFDIEESKIYFLIGKNFIFLCTSKHLESLEEEKWHTFGFFVDEFNDILNNGG